MLKVWVLLLNVACLHEASVSQQASDGSGYTLHLSEGRVETHEGNSKLKARLMTAKLAAREGLASNVQIVAGSARRDKSPLQFAELAFSFARQGTAYACTLTDTRLQREIAFSTDACLSREIATQTHDQNATSSSINLKIKLTNLSIVREFAMRLLQGWRKKLAVQNVSFSGIKKVYREGTDCEQEVLVDQLAQRKMTEKHISYEVRDREILVWLDRHRTLADVDCDTSHVIFTAQANDATDVIMHMIGLDKDKSGADYRIGYGSGKKKTDEKIMMFATPVRFSVIEVETTP